MHHYLKVPKGRAIEPRASTNAPLSTSTPSNSFEFQQLAASLEDKMDIRMSRLEKMICEKNATTPATVKAVEEVCVTCGSNHNFNNCPNPPNLANQMRPPGFNQPNVQNNQGNQSRYQGNNFNSNQNRGGNFNQGQVYQPPTIQTPAYQAPIPQIQGVSKTDFDNYVKANDAVLKNVQNQGQNLQNQMANVTSLLTSLCNNFKNSASTSNSGTLPSQTVTNPREHVNAITTRSGKTCEGPSTPLVPTPVVSIPSKEPEQNPETSMDKVQKPSSESTAQVPPPEEEDSIFIEIPKPKAKKTVNVEIQDLNSPRPNSYQSKLPYPERMKVRENDKPSAQHSRFLKMFKQLRLEIGLKDALVEMPKFNKWLSSLLRNKEKLEEIAITTVNAEFSTTIIRALPPSSSPVKTSDNLEEFADELTLLKKDVHMDEDVVNKNSNVSDEPILLNTPLTDKVECFAPEDDIDEIDAFLAMKVSSNFEEGYFDSEGDVIFLENLLSDDTTHNLAPEVIPIMNQNKMNLSITFSPGVILITCVSLGEILTFLQGSFSEHEDYLKRMTLLVSFQKLWSRKLFMLIQV
ncbi:hypothetical protein Tco_0615364 [Tanacetum coccineum]